MKNGIFWIAFLLFAGVAHAQFSISGSIREAKSNEILSGANVFLKGTKLGASTNDEGNFVIRGVDEGSYILVVSFVGYKDNERLLQVNKDIEVEILLQPDVIIANEVIVSATRVDENSPTAFETVSSAEIQKKNLARDIPYLLEQTPGVVTYSDAGGGVGYSGLRIRGSDPSRINVTINGVPLNDSESQTVFWVDIPDFASSVKSIQIQRGVGTSTNGSGAFGASINIESGNMKDEAGVTIDNSFGSFNTRKHTLSLGTGLINNTLNFTLRLSQISSDGYIDRASSLLKSYYFSGGYYGNKHSLTTTIFSGKELTYQSWDGVSEADLMSNRTFNVTGQIGPDEYYDNQVDDYKQDHYQLHYVFKPNSFFNLSLSLHYTKGKGFFEQYRVDDLFSNYGLSDLVIGTQIISSTDLIRRRWLDNDFYGSTFSAIYSPSKKVKLTFGGAINKYVGNHFGQIIWAQFAGNSSSTAHYYDNKGSKSEKNFYLKPEINLTKNLFIFGDIQWRNVNYQVNGIDNDQRALRTKRSYNFINPKFGISYWLGLKSLVYVSYGVGAREPDRNDFIDAEAGKAPKHEGLNDLEAGFRRNSDRFNVSVNFFNMNYKNQLVLTGELNDVGTPIRRNVDKSHRTGIEVTTSWSPFKTLTLSGNVSFSVNRIKSFDESVQIYDPSFNYLRDSILVYRNTDIILSPNWVAFAKVSFQPIKELEFSFEGKYVGDQYLDNKSSQNRKLDDYLVNNLNVLYRLNLEGKFIKQFQANFTINNIFNVKYEPNGYSYFILFDGGSQVTQENYNYY